MNQQNTDDPDYGRDLTKYPITPEERADFVVTNIDDWSLREDVRTRALLTINGAITALIAASNDVRTRVLAAIYGTVDTQARQLVILAAEVFPPPMDHTGAIEVGRIVNGKLTTIEAITVSPETARTVRQLLADISGIRLGVDGMGERPLPKNI